MAYDFTADEIFKMAEEIERNGAKFYRTASENVTDGAAKKFLLNLAAMELAHEKIFLSLREALPEKDRAATVFDPENEAVLYLRALADTRVFFKKELPGFSIEEIFKAAIEAEKDSIVFYLGMKESVPEKFGKRQVDLIIKEEMKHVRLLSNKLLETR
ncbi:MAG: ferritin family protein [Desulfobacterales bacterium]|nr:ferritin family protein [Desulfobacterales bacterium]